MNARAALALLACCIGFAAADCRSEVIVGLHIASAHVPAKEHHENVNPGGYVQVERVVGGVYRNSIGRTTVYGAYAHPLGGGFDLLAGVGSGYQRKDDGSGFSRGALTPVVGATYTAPRVFGAAPRIWLIPGSAKSSTVFHLSLQREF
jgi:hypothetical protein